MKRFIVLLIVLTLTIPAYASKKDDKIKLLEADKAKQEQKIKEQEIKILEVSIEKEFAIRDTLTFQSNSLKKDFDASLVRQAPLVNTLKMLDPNNKLFLKSKPIPKPKVKEEKKDEGS